MKQTLYNSILSARAIDKKLIAILIDPDKFNPAVVKNGMRAGVDYFFVGGSLITGSDTGKCIDEIKKQCSIPVIIFPGSHLQIYPKADGILLLSLISGRNPEYLIGHHVLSARLLKSSGLEIMPTGYILVDSGNQTTASYISHSLPIPSSKDEIAVSTAIAGEMLGLKMIYLDGGSGAINPPSSSMITAVKKNINVPLIAGGGIRTPQQAKAAFDAGADMIVIGNAVEQKPELINDIVECTAEK